MGIQLHDEANIREDCSAVVSELREIILSLIPYARIEEIGSTAIAGALTKGDVDLLVSVEVPHFEAAKQVLEGRFSVNEGMEGIAHFASFKGSSAGIEYGIQLATINECEFGFIRFRDLLQQSPDLVQRYNAVKLAACHSSMDEYRAKKNEFIEATLQQDQSIHTE